MESRPHSIAISSPERLLPGRWRLPERLSQLWRTALQMLRALFPHWRRSRQLRPWMLVLRRKARSRTQNLTVSAEQTARLLERMRNLDDCAELAQRAVAFSGSGTDFFADPERVERIIEALIRENPPFLHLACDGPSGEEGSSAQRQVVFLRRESETIIQEPCTLFIPQTEIEHREHRRPPGNPVLRTARTLSDLRAAPLLYQSLPEDLLIARMLEGSIPVLAYREDRRYLMFRAEERLLTRREKRVCEVAVEIEGGVEGEGARLIYLLFDRSTSLVHGCAPRGINAVMELAIAAAMLRVDLGRPNARYYFRSFADVLIPKPEHPPHIAASVQEKDHLVRELFETNFSGEATRTVEALTVAADDIERILESREPGQNVKPRICLLTDGRCTVYGEIGARLERMGIELDTILIGPDAAYNPELARISSTVSLVDPALYHLNEGVKS
jgi:hypothetical protein